MFTATLPAMSRTSAHSSSAPLSLREAFALLGLKGPTDPETMAAAFRTAVKAARPDLPNGDEARFRRVIEAYQLVRALGPQRPALPPPPPVPPAEPPPPIIRLTPMEALSGACKTVRAPGAGTLRVMIPPGLRTGEQVRLRRAGAGRTDLCLPVLIGEADGLWAVGDDLYMTAPVDPRVLRDGGRIEIDTHAGPQSGWVVAGMAQPVRLRLRDLGLPARGGRPQGHLFVTLRAEEVCPSPAKDLLHRFETVWTAGRLAA